MATCQLTYQTFKDYPFTTWKMWSQFTSIFSLPSKLKLFLTLACNTWILLLDNWQQDIYGRLLKTEGKKGVNYINYHTIEIYCEIMGLDGIFRKNKMKNAPLPKISLLVQIGGEIQAPLCSDDVIQILLKQPWINPGLC